MGGSEMLLRIRDAPGRAGSRQVAGGRENVV
jgi:hypothetical protein